jgi:hypothetical protein
MYRYRQIENVVPTELENLLNKEAKDGWELASTYNIMQRDPWSHYHNKLNVVLRRDRRLDSFG